MDNLLEILLKFVQPELLVLCVVLYVAVELVKKTPIYKPVSNWIPLIVLALAIVLSIAYIFITVGASWQSGLSAIIQGILISGIVILCYEGIGKFFTKNKNESK